ncbi:hypothetical protein INT48_007256 [Thamnidium elegans]|uniref:Ion transport domain-containing protein n=1 Tax=Thamnidium elegans TaxID=101142 RepID=A0A8H7SHB3_9FUNG|nr:hypothetical protein INT48_007256 [Thamnidium elegans]
MSFRTCPEIELDMSASQTGKTLADENASDLIDSHNIKGEDVILLDISINKEWMAYVTIKHEDIDGTSNLENNEVHRTYLTRRRFTAVNAENSEDRITLKENKQKYITNDEYFRIDITNTIKSTNRNHSKFLSISRDGKYIALSFYSETSRFSYYEKGRKYNKCFIFEAGIGRIDLKSSLNFNGRAIFLNSEEVSLIYADAYTFRYGNLSDISSDRTVFDLSILGPGSFNESSVFDELYIRNSAWLDFSEENNDMKKAVTFTRNVRHDIITTPYLDVTRAWSLTENGVRLTSLWIPGLHIMAFSKDYKFTAAYVEGARSIHIYNVKSSLLAYQLKSQESGLVDNFEVSHIRFCYSGRYVAMSGWEGNEVVFEIWHLESERSIYKISRNVGERAANFDATSKQLKVFEPFVTKVYNRNSEKCLVGFYMSNNSNHLKTNFLELKMDSVCEPISIIREDSNGPRYMFDNTAWDTSLSSELVKRKYINIGEEKLLVRFDEYTVQLWKIESDYTAGQLIGNGDELLYIRAYKGPYYGRDYSFRDTWKICNYNSIKFIGGNASGRILVNIMKALNEDGSPNYNFKDYHTEEIFLPLCGVGNQEKFDGHKLESACQALHFLREIYGFNSVTEACYKDDLNKLRSKTEELVKSSVESIDSTSSYFSNITGSREYIIKLIIAKNISIAIFSHHRPLSELKEKYTDEYLQEDILDWCNHNKIFQWSQSLLKKAINVKALFHLDNTTYDATTIDNIPDDDSTRTIATNENVLTVLIEKASNDLFNLLFNRILLDSKELGPGCLLSLMDALVFLQEGNSDFGPQQLGLSVREFYNYFKSCSVSQKDVFGDINMGPYSIPEELKKVTNFEWKKINRKRDKFYSAGGSFFRTIKLLIKLYKLKYLINVSTMESKAGLSESAFTRIASNQRTNNIFRQGGTFEALLNYKWKTFAKRKFAMICFIHALYYVSYCTGVLFSRVLYVKGPENELDMKHPGHLASLAIMGLSLSILIIQEFRQFLNTMNKMSYLASGYNWVDIAAFGFPIFTVFQSLLEWDHFAEVCSIATLILWSHSILRLRAIPSFGVTLDIIIQLFRNVFATIFIMFLVIIAFTMSFVVLLLSKENEYFQDNFEGSFTSGTITAHGLINTANVSTDNGFRNWFKAFSKVWLFIYGVWDPVTEGDVGDNMMVMALCILFSFVTMFIFSNMIVALMSNPIEEVRRNGKKA